MYKVVAASSEVQRRLLCLFGVFTSVFMNKAESCNQLLSRPPTNEGRDGVFMTSPLEGGTMSCMQPWLAWKDFARSSGGGSIAF